jgi:hypothetical protein
MSHITKQGSAFPLKKRGGREMGRGAAWRRDRDPDATHHKKGLAIPPLIVWRSGPGCHSPMSMASLG